MSLERTVREFLFEPNKTLDFSRNAEFIWKDRGDGSFEIRVPIVSLVSNEFSFLVHISSATLLSMMKPTMGIYYQVKTRVAGICYHTPHRNPGGRRFTAKAHSHRYTDIDGDKIADDVSFLYPDHGDLLGAVNTFLSYTKIVTIPDDWFNIPEGFGRGIEAPTLWD